MGNTYSDLSSLLHSYSSVRAHTRQCSELPLGKPGTKVVEPQSTCSEDGGTTSKKEVNATWKVAPVAGPVEALQAAAAKICAQPGFPASSPDAKEEEDLDATMPDADAQQVDALPCMVDPSIGPHVRAADEAQLLGGTYAVQPGDELAVLVIVSYAEGHKSVMALSEKPLDGAQGGVMDARACTLPSITLGNDGWACSIMTKAVTTLFPGNVAVQKACEPNPSRKAGELLARNYHYYLAEHAQERTMLVVVAVQAEELLPMTAFAAGDHHRNLGLKQPRNPRRACDHPRNLDIKQPRNPRRASDHHRNLDIKPSRNPR